MVSHGITWQSRWHFRLSCSKAGTRFSKPWARHGANFLCCSVSAPLLQVLELHSLHWIRAEERVSIKSRQSVVTAQVLRDITNKRAAVFSGYNFITQCKQSRWINSHLLLKSRKSDAHEIFAFYGSCGQRAVKCVCVWLGGSSGHSVDVVAGCPLDDRSGDDWSTPMWRGWLRSPEWTLRRPDVLPRHTGASSELQ